LENIFEEAKGTKGGRGLGLTLKELWKKENWISLQISGRTVRIFFII